MIKAGFGFSQDENGVKAARKAAFQALSTGDMERADWALVFSTFPYRSAYKDILNSIGEVIKTKDVVGCSALGVLTNMGEIEAEPAVSVLAVSSDSIRASTFIVKHSGDGGVKAGIEIGQKFVPVEEENALLMLLCDPFFLNPELVFRGIESQLGEIPIVGAAASEHPMLSETFEFCGDTVISGAVCGAILEGSFTYRIGITQGCQPVGNPCIVTKADRNIIFELDGQPAFEVLKKQVPKSLVENPKDMLRLLFVGFTPDPHEIESVEGDYLVRNIIGFNPDSGVIGVAENVREGQVITFTMRNPELAREDLKRMLERVVATGDPRRPFKFGLYFNCCARGMSLYGYRGIDTAYITSFLGDIPIVGFFGNAEFGPLRGRNCMFTYTGVLVLIGE
ncbi:hypothetical protein HRbin37_00834 [bacterium HR37]|nr:hypothetical protein HRbin37_00834 [bacterium HR37]